MPHFNVISRACKVTVVGIEYNSATFLTSFQEGPHQELFFQGIFQTSGSKMTNYIIVDIVLCCYQQTHLNFFFH